ncbi:hypothetical protein BJV74DRAFT_828126 [Russula compacta]|nr:hypothetical protein BJV74DRAFT_828126 [Russula compacta]
MRDSSCIKGLRMASFGIHQVLSQSRIKMSKPVLYTFPQSIWAAAAHLALAELAIDSDFSVVNLVEGENFKSEFLKLNPNATIPTLTHGGKSFTSTADVINYLVTISSVKVTPESSITAVVHEDNIDPNFAFVAARNEEELTKISNGFGNVFTTTRLGHLKRYAATPEAQANKAFYDKRIASISGLYAILNNQAPDEAKQGFFTKSTALWDGIKAFTLERLPAAIAQGPFIGGARPGVDDFHVGAWLARIASILGAQKSEEGVSALEKTFGPLPEKVKVYWATWIARDSWVKTYRDNVLY